MITKDIKIEIPNTKIGSGLVFVRKSWYALYYENGKQKRIKLDTPDKKTAEITRDRIYRRLKKEGAVLKERQTPEEKIAAGRKTYIYKQLPFKVVVKGNLLGQFKTYKEAETVRDEYLKNKKL